MYNCSGVALSATLSPACLLNAGEEEEPQVTLWEALCAKSSRVMGIISVHEKILSSLEGNILVVAA